MLEDSTQREERLQAQMIECEELKSQLLQKQQELDELHKNQAPQPKLQSDQASTSGSVEPGTSLKNVDDKVKVHLVHLAFLHMIITRLQTFSRKYCICYGNYTDSNYLQVRNSQ